MPASYQELCSQEEWERLSKETIAHGRERELHGVVTSELCIKHGATLLRHQFNGFGNHRLWAGATASPWTSYQGIARAGKFGAATEYYAGSLPAVFKIEVVAAHHQAVAEVG